MNEALVEFYMDFFQNELSRDDIVRVIEDTAPNEHFTELQKLKNHKRDITVVATEAPTQVVHQEEKDPYVHRIICDMHGFNRSSALQYARRTLLSLQAEYSYEVEFIVGKGRHNRFGRSLVKEDVADICTSLGFKWVESKQNEGKIHVSVLRNEDPKEKLLYHYETPPIRRNARNTAKQEWEAAKSPMPDDPR